MVEHCSRPRLTRSRRVNPRIFLFSSCETTIYYADDEIPENRVTKTDCSDGHCTDKDRRRKLVHSTQCKKPVFTNSLQGSSDESDFIALTADQPIIKEARVLSQGLPQNLSLQRKRNPKLLKFQPQKYYCSSYRREISDLESESESPFPKHASFIVNATDLRNTFSQLSTESSLDTSDSDNFGVRSRRRLRTKSFFQKDGSLDSRTSTSVDERSPMYLSGETDFHEIRRKSLSVCGLLTSSGKIPRKQSKALRMLCASEGFTIPSMSRPSSYFECDDFVMRTRKFSMNRARKLLFVPSGEIRIYRLTNEKFFSTSELIDILYDNQCIFFP
ncbi:hypothetical protein KIN20_022839 [Parelaphostrongylus tenuis]|uniref:Uncharacterized protein n=1 Tax=Parelaphostrongylus tenuis TaxID=148309 RepID=A0AAD5NBU4_PARTN|nr:hypothetical protein KIN20_022839 [Parelaphostrongylus tenuis]